MASTFPYKNVSGERLVYISGAGQAYTLHNPPWRAVLSEEGFGTPPIEYVTDRAPFAHGDTVRSFHLGPRPIQLVIIHNFCNRAEYWEGRNQLLNVIRPLQLNDGPPNPGTLLYYRAGGTKRALNVFLDSGPGFTPSDGGWREWTFTEALRFTAHDPVWYDPDAKSKNLLGSIEVEELVFPARFPIWFGEAAAALQNRVYYQGTWPTYPIVKVTGPITGFSITNKVTGDRLALTRPVPATYTVTFDLTTIKTVTGDRGESWMPYVSPDSDLATFSLVPHPQAPLGINQMQVGGTGTSPLATRVVIEYYEKYIGI